MKEILACPVCALPLARAERKYTCPKGHSFDLSRQGYVNLLLSKGAAVHGDNAMMIASRRRFLAAGYYAPLAEALCDMLATHARECTTLLDVGCGEGYYTEHAARTLSQNGGSVYAFDISKDALKAAAGRRCATLFVAGAYKMPVLDGSVDAVTLLFSPFCREEILRVLQPSGLFFMAYPGERHLFGLKQAIYETPYLNRPEPTEIEGFALLEKRDIAFEITLPSSEAIGDLFKMTPYYYKTGVRDHEKLAALACLTTEISFHLCAYKKIIP